MEDLWTCGEEGLTTEGRIDEEDAVDHEYFEEVLDGEDAVRMPE